MSEEFEKWWRAYGQDNYNNEYALDDGKLSIYKAAFAAGQAAEREECAKVADSSCNDFDNIAATIRARGGDK